ncbi:pentatricopeptide repeat-containing protein [Tanacetum coccineum]
MWSKLTSYRYLTTTKHPLTNILKPISSLAQSTPYSDTSSDENNNALSTISPINQPNKFTVIETLHKLAKKPNLALSYMTHLKECTFKHDVVTYMAIVRLLCKWGLDIKLYYVFLDVVNDKDGSFFKFSVEDLVEVLLEEIKVSGYLVKGVDVLVKVYASLGRFEEAVDVLFKVRRGGVVLSTRTCNYLMNQLIVWEKFDMVESVYKQLKRKGLVADVYTYGILVKGFCRKGCLEEAEGIFKEMKEVGVEPNAFAFGTYIDGLCSNGKVESGLKLVQSLRESNVEVNVYAYSSIIRRFVKELKLQEAESVLLDMKNADIVPDAVCYCALILKEFFLDEVSFNIAIDALCKLGKINEAMALLREMKSRKMEPDVMHYTTLINGYCLLGEPWSAFNIFEEMKENGLEPDVITFDVLVSGLVIEGLCKGGKVKEAELFYSTFEYKSLDLYAAMVNGYCEANNTSKAYKLCFGNRAVVKRACLINCLKEAYYLFNDMRNRGIKPDIITYTVLLNGSRRSDDVSRISSEIEEMGLSPDVVCYTVMIDRHCKLDNLREAVCLFDEMIDKGLQPNTVTYTALVCGYCSHGYMNKAETLVDEMISKGIQPNERTMLALTTVKAKKMQFRP